MSGTIVVTGAAGFIGSHLCEALLNRGHAVVGVDNFDPFYDDDLKKRNLARCVEHTAFRLERIDVRDVAGMRTVTGGASAVVHVAARPGVRDSLTTPIDTVDINVRGTVAVLEASRLSGVRRFVLASSSSVYGTDTPVPFREEAPCVRPGSPYAASKRSAELWSRTYADLHGFRTAVLRLFTVYGPRQRPDLAIRRFVECLDRGDRIPQFGDGRSERDYTHVSDVTSGVLAALAWTESADPDWQVFNIAAGRPVRLSRIIELVGCAMRVDPRIDTQPPSAGEVERTWADITKAQRVLGYQPSVAVEDGVYDFIRWYESRDGRQS